MMDLRAREESLERVEILAFQARMASLDHLGREDLLEKMGHPDLLDKLESLDLLAQQ